MGLFKTFVTGGLFGVVKDGLNSSGGSSSSSGRNTFVNTVFTGPVINRKRIAEETVEVIKDILDKSDAPIAEKAKRTIEKLENLQKTIDNAKDSLDLTNRLARLLAKEDTDLLQADHLYVQRPTYTHHGLYLGGGEVIHYLLGEGITTDSIETFADGAKVFVQRSSPIKYAPEKVIGRAFTRLGEKQYNLATNNCEHYVRWCRNGD